ncbi:Hypothetical predicted protein [Pelobates cultripes]|uniref:Uncharacterized protein n=1 Tax=Pelobates cultripes TaxID=61616 RepID=A0AAD1VNW5_PELCU|nr:Hypothetical predicted protein [Pelobates cultripes]
MPRSKQQPSLLIANNKITVYDDLPFSVLLDRRKFVPVTRVLHDQGIRYRWGMSQTLVVQHGEAMKVLLASDDHTSTCSHHPSLSSRGQQHRQQRTPACNKNAGPGKQRKQVTRGGGTPRRYLQIGGPSAAMERQEDHAVIQGSLSRPNQRTYHYSVNQHCQRHGLPHADLTFS